MIMELREPLETAHWCPHRGRAAAWVAAVRVGKVGSYIWILDIFLVYTIFLPISISTPCCFSSIWPKVQTWSVSRAWAWTSHGAGEVLVNCTCTLYFYLLICSTQTMRQAGQTVQSHPSGTRRWQNPQMEGPGLLIHQYFHWPNLDQPQTNPQPLSRSLLGLE